MALKRSLVALCAASVGLAVLAACVVAYVAVRSELYGQVDDQLRETRFIASGPTLPAGVRPTLPRVRDPGPRRGGPAGYVQLVSAAGTVRALRGDLKLPVDARTRDIAISQRGSVGPHTVTVKGVAVRTVAFAAAGRGAVQVGRPLDATNRVLRRLRWALLVVLLGGIALAVLLARRVGGHFTGVLSELETTNGALDASLRAQRQLVADASHELRTPVTSLRTNVEVLLDGDELDAGSRAQLLDDVREQTEELGALVGDLIDLARGDVQDSDPQDVRLDALVREAVARARRHVQGAVVFELTAVPVSVSGVPERLGRAINNLLDNAVRHSPPGAAVEVCVDEHGVAVRDHGPGLDTDDPAQLFARFHRGAEQRAGTGTGLGLAIVLQVAEAHGASVHAADADGGGAVFVFAIPTSSPAPAVRSRGHGHQ